MCACALCRTTVALSFSGGFRSLQVPSGLLTLWREDSGGPPPASPGLRPRLSLTSTPDMQAMFDKKALTIINFHVNIVSPPEIRMFVFLSAKSLFGVDFLKNSMK